MITNLQVSLIPALALTLLLAVPLPAAAEPEEARRRGLAYLLETQLPVGGWVSEQFGLTSTGHKIAITAVAAHALVATAPDDGVRTAAERAVSFIRRYEGELREPRSNGGFDYTPWAAALGMVHLRSLQERWPRDEASPDLGGLIETFAQYAARTQRPCGGWDYRIVGRDGTKLVDGSVPFLTAVMLDGLRAWGLGEGLRKKAIEDLVSSTGAEGMLGYSHDGDHAEVKAGPWWSPEEAAGRTLQARLVLARCKQTGAVPLEPALEHFLAVREKYAEARGKSEHAKPHEIAGYYYYHAHYYAMCALRHLVEQDPSCAERVQGQAQVLLRALLKEQDEDGSWEDAPAGGKAYGTAMALLSLREYRDIRVRWSEDLATGLDQARRSGRPLVLLLLDQNDASRKMVDLFYGPALARGVNAAVLVKLDRRANQDTALRGKVYRGPALLVLDPRLEDPLRSPMKKLIGGRDAEKVRSVLGKAIEAFQADER